MFEFDSLISNYANAHGLVYTRYADDITMSSEGHLDKNGIMTEINSAITVIDFPRLKLNLAKTKLASKSTSRRVTGLVLANDGALSLGRDRKRQISAMVHHATTGQSDTATIAHLAGLLSFANDIEPSFVAAIRKKYGDANIEALQIGETIDI